MSEDQNIDAHDTAASDDNPSIFSEAGDDKLHAELSEIYDRSQAAQERAEDRATMPAATTNDEGRPDTLHETFTKSYEWLHSTPKEQATQRDANKLVEQVRENAAKFGVTLTDAEAMDKAMALEQMQAQQANSTPSIPAELQPAMQAIQQNYPGRQAHEVVSEFAQIDSDFKRDPINTAFRVLQERTGISPLEIVRQVAAAHSPQQHQQFYAERDAEVVANAFMAAYPDVDQEAVIAALAKIPRSGNMAADLAKAYEMAGQKPSRPSRKGQRRSMESEMAEVYQRVNRR